MENSNNPYDPNNPFPDPREEKLGVPLTIVSFCIPLVGIVLYFVNKDKSPQKAQTACYAAIGGLVLGVILQVIKYSAMGRGY